MKQTIIILLLSLITVVAFADAIEVTPNELDFGDVIVGSSPTMSFTITSNLEQIITISVPQFFTTDINEVAVTNGQTQVVNVTFIPTDIGNYNSNIVLTGSIYGETIVSLFAEAMDSLSGEISGTLESAYSPYVIDYDVTVPAGQTLTIEPGVEVIFNGNYSLTINGTLISNGTAEEKIYFHGAGESAQGGIYFDTEESEPILEHCIVENMFDGEFFYDDFEDGLWDDNWSGSSVVGISTSSHYEGSKSLQIYAYDTDASAQTDAIVIGTDCVISCFFKVDLSEYSCRTYFYWRKNNGSWHTLYSTNRHTTYDWTYKEWDISSSVTFGDEIQFKVVSDIDNSDNNSDQQTTYLDNVQILTNAVVSSSNDITIVNSEITGNTGNGISALGDITFTNSEITGNIGNGISGGRDVNVTQSIIHSNTGMGINSNGAVNLDYSVVAYNGGNGINISGYRFSTINNSILWYNDNTNHQQIYIENGTLNTTYSNIEGISSFGISGEAQFINGEGCIESNPVFVDADYHLSENSPCVDAASPWQHDANMPFGLGTIRADMGAYGGPNNGGWGGNPIPNGTPTIDNIIDIPQDQGGFVGIQYQASVFDGQHSAYDVSHYSFWRELEVEDRESVNAQIHPIYSQSNESIIYTRDGEYWEWVGEMVAQDFTNYGFTAPTLADSTEEESFASTFIVIAHTEDDQIYWTSEPMTGYSIDNIAPLPPQNLGRNISPNSVSLNWEQPEEQDYQSTTITKNGTPIFTGGGTEFIDENIEADTEYLYEIIHTDNHFNDSEPSTINVRTISWNIECVASSNGNSSSLILGTADDGTTGFDTEYDQATPPNPPSNFISIYTNHPEWENPLGNNYNQDIANEVPLDDAMQIWEVHLFADNEGTVNVQFNFSDNIPAVPVFIYQVSETRRNSRDIIFKEQITNGESYSFDLEANAEQIFYLAIGDITPPEVAVTSPNGLEILQSGEEVTFIWEATDGFMLDNNVVSISYDGENFDEIGTTSENSILFTPENPLSNNCYIKVVSTDFAGNSSEDISDYEFTVVGSEFETELNAGWNLWSSPLELTTTLAEQIEDDFEEEYFAYNWLNGSYSEVENINAGESIWLGFMEDAEFTFEGNPYTNAMEVSYNSGWNMIANPLVRNIDKSMLTIIVDEQEYTFDEAVTNGFVAEDIYEFSNNVYQTVDQLEYMKGYWFGVYEDEITVKYAPHEAIETVRESCEREYYWQVEINELNIAGMENSVMDWDENDIPLPPADPTGVIANLYISHPEWENVLGNNFSSDIRPINDLEETQTYNIVISEPQILNCITTDIADDVEVFLTIGETVYDLVELEELSVEPCNATLQIGRYLLGVEDDNAVPLVTELIGNYPNPFNPTTKIDFALNKESDVEITIYNIKGQIIKQLTDQVFDIGYHNVIWNGDDDNGNNVSSGVYFYRFTTDDYSKINKMILLK